MPDVLVIGGSVAGLATALVCSELGRDVLVLEREGDEPPDDVAAANRDWNRPTVPQVWHSHAFGSLGTNLLWERAADIYAGMVDAGALEIDLAGRMPPTLDDRTRAPGDEQLRMLGTRRASFEAVLRRMVLRRPRVRVELGTTVRGLETTANGAARVAGVRTDTGRRIAADVVVDAAGRRSPAERWLRDAGLPVAPTSTSSCQITYYTRFYRSQTPGPAGPLNRGFGAGGLWSHSTGVLFLATTAPSRSPSGCCPTTTPSKGLRDPDRFTAAVRATPLLAPWVAPGASEPISTVHVMGGLDNSLRGIATLAQPPLAGLFHVGDAAATTNPAYGRGVSLALAHAHALGEVLAAHEAVDVAQNRLMAEATERLLRPWYEEALANDAGRAGLWRATLAGRAPAAPPPGVVTFGAVAQAAATDAVVWRRLVRVMMSLDAPETVYADDEVRERVRAALAAGPPHQPPEPARAQLVDAATSAAA